MKKLLSGLLILGLCCPALGMSGNEWLSDLEAEDPSGGLGAWAYIAGVFHQHNLGGVSLECVKYPEEVTVGQVGRILQKYMSENPEITHAPVTAIFHVAMRDAFGTKPLGDDGFC